MSYQLFTSRIQAKFGNVNIRHENGKHIAVLPSGIRITGNTISEKVTIKWGSGHVAMANL